MRRYLTAALDILYPHLCPNCSTPTAALFCDRCEPLVGKIGRRACLYCGQPTPIAMDGCFACRGRRLHFDRARAVWAYEGIARDVICDFKFNNHKALAAGLADYLPPLLDEVDIITFVPLSRRKTWSRGYNQAALLATRLSNLTGIACAPLLRRIRHTADQNRLSRAERRRNVLGAFAVDRPKFVIGAKIALIDDVYTTGSTVSACAKELKAAGAAAVQVATLARA